MPPINYFNLFNLTLFLLTTFLSLDIIVDHKKWEVYSDTHDYLRQSRMSLMDSEFYIPSKKEGFYPRPFTVPLFYKACGSNKYIVVIAQRIMHFLSAFFLAYALSLFIRSSALKYLMAVSLYLIMSWWNVLEWTIIPLSESLSISFFLCWLASFILLLHKKNNPSFILHLLITFLFSFTRDTWPYILISFYILFCMVFYFWQKDLLKKSIRLVLFVCLLFFIQQYTSEFGNRHRLPVTNTIVIRILPNQEYFQWFVNEGMPCSDSLKKNFSNINFYNNENKISVYHLYTDTSYKEWHDWINKHGKSTYTKFLLTHPSYSFLLEESPEYLQRIFTYNLFYTSPPKGYSLYIEPYLPFFEWKVVLILSIVLLFFFIHSKKIISLLPAILIIVSLLNVLLSYNADAFEVERHLFITNIVMHFIGVISLVILIDYILEFTGHKKAKPL